MNQIFDSNISKNMTKYKKVNNQRNSSGDRMKKTSPPCKVADWEGWGSGLSHEATLSCSGKHFSTFPFSNNIQIGCGSIMLVCVFIHAFPIRARICYCTGGDAFYVRSFLDLRLLHIQLFLVWCFND